MKLKKLALGLALISVVSTTLVGCGGGAGEESANKDLDLNSMKLEEIVEKAKEEGDIQSVGMPDTWANWKDTWEGIAKEYGITHTDTDMSSAEELALFESEKSSPTKDIGDVGQSFGPIAVEKELSLPYKTSYWDEIPDWAKDEDGHYIVSYTGTMSIVTNTSKVKNPPKSFKDLLDGDYKVTVGDVNAATQAQNAVLSAAIANGGDESNLKPGIELFAKLAEQGRLDLGEASLARLENGEIEVGLFWDFNALNYKDTIESQNENQKFEVVIPSDGSIQSGYSTIINRYAPHPHAAALAREYILSDKGQINLAIGYARPIRDKVELPKEVKDKLLPDEMYTNVSQIKDTKLWDESAKKLGQDWQNEVLSKVKK